MVFNGMYPSPPTLLSTYGWVWFFALEAITVAIEFIILYLLVGNIYQLNEKKEYEKVDGLYKFLIVFAINFFSAFLAFFIWIYLPLSSW